MLVSMSGSDLGNVFHPNTKSLTVRNCALILTWSSAYKKCRRIWLGAHNAFFSSLLKELESNLTGKNPNSAAIIP